MKYLFLILCTVLLGNSSLFAQPIIEWQHTIGASSTEDMGEIIQTLDGGYLIVSTSSSGMNGDKTETNYGLNDFWILKLNNLGNIEWQNTIGSDSFDSPTSCIQLIDSTYFIAGHSMSGVNADKSEPNIGERDYWIMKLDKNGVLLWEETIGGDQRDILTEAIQTYDGGFLLGGYSLSGISGDKTQASLGNEDYWIVKVDSNGNFLWDESYGGSGVDYLLSVLPGPDSTFVLAGYSGSDISTDKSENAFGINDMWVVKIDSVGNIIWDNTIGGDSGEGLFDAVVTSDSGFVLAGNSMSGISGDKSEPSFGNFDYWIVKIDSLGTVVWENTLGGDLIDQAQSVQETSDLGFIINGRSNSGISGDKTEPVWGGGVQEDFWVVKLDQAGNLLWENTIGGTNKEEAAVGIETLDGGYLVGGRSSSLANGDKTETSFGSSDLWIIKLSCDGTDVDGDGYCIATDCNDNDPLINPGMTEIQCNGIDDDCNPLTTDLDTIDPDTPVLADSISECSVTLTAPTTTDACAGIITGTTTDPLTYSTEGTYVVNWTFDDGSGNVITVPQNVIIDDVTDPIAPVLADSIGECSASVPVPTTTDNCGGVITGTTTFPLTYNTQGQFIVYWIFDDGNGNSIVVPQTVIVDDVTNPDTPILPDLVGICSVTAAAPMTSDNCAGAITGTTTDPLTYNAPGTYAIQWLFDDGNGNSITVPQNVIVIDSIAPVPDLASLPDIDAPCPLTNLTPPSATDNCAGNVIVTNDANLPLTSDATITWTYDDGNGNTATQTQFVSIIPIDNGISAIDGITLTADAAGYQYQWLDCDNGNAPINGATNQTFVATSNGNYAVQIGNGACSSTSSCLPVNEVNLDETTPNILVQIQPNPTKGVFTLQADKAIVPSEIQLVNALGQTIAFECQEIDQGWEITFEGDKGIYFVQIEGRIVDKLLKL